MLVTVLQVHVQVWVILVYVGHHPPTPPVLGPPTLLLLALNLLAILTPELMYVPVNVIQVTSVRVQVTAVAVF